MDEEHVNVNVGKPALSAGILAETEFLTYPGWEFTLGGLALESFGFIFGE